MSLVHVQQARPASGTGFGDLAPSGDNIAPAAGVSPADTETASLEHTTSHAERRRLALRTRSEAAIQNEANSEVVPNLAANLDRMLTSPGTGRRTWVYWLAQLQIVATGVHVAFGTVITDDLVTLYYTGDAVMAFGVGVAISMFCFVFPAVLEDTRRKVRDTPDGPLRMLGVGVVKISQTEMDTLKKMEKTLNPRFETLKAWLVYHVPSKIPWVAAAWFNFGIHDHAHNVASIMLLETFFNGSFWLMMGTKIAMATAMAIL